MRPSLRQVLFRSVGLDLNFAGGVFSLTNTRTGAVAAIPGWSFSRTDTNGTATALDLAGNVIQFATGVPRITNRGILVEEARTNLLLNSATLSTQTVTTTAAAHTLSFYGTGTVTLTGASTAGPLVGTGANNRVTLTFTPLAAPLLLTVTGSVTTAQLEAGAFATSPIITTGAAGTRGADVPLITGLTITPPFTVFGEYAVSGNDATNFRRVVGLWNTGETIEHCIYQRHTNNLVRAFVTTDADSTIGTGSTTAVNKAAVRFATNDLTGSLNGAAVTTDSSVAVTTMTRMYFGTSIAATPQLNGYIQRIRILPTALPDAQLQALTAP